MKTYKKKPLTYSEQIELLKSRGLSIPNEEKASRYLGEISYYRLSAYSLPFQKVKDQFDEGTTFENVLDLYLFDRELRLICFDCIERIEVAIRAQFIYSMAHKYNDSHWQDDASLFEKAFTIKRTNYTVQVFQDTQDLIQKQLTIRHPEVFVKHYKTTYNKPQNPPSWMSVELLTIGQLSRLYKALDSNTDKKAIANFFGLHHTVFTSWLHTLVYVRNICAHHSRLWNRDFAIKPDVLRRPQKDWISSSINSNNNRTFYFLCLLKYLLQSANPTNHLKQKLNSLFEKYPNAPIQFMGIPTLADNVTPIDWRNEPLWSE